MVGYTLAVKPGYGFGSFLPGKVIIQITVDNGVVFQFCKTFLQITDGVHYEKIGLAIYTNMEISFSVELLIREEIHKASNTQTWLWIISLLYLMTDMSFPFIHPL